MRKAGNPSLLRIPHQAQFPYEASAHAYGDSRALKIGIDASSLIAQKTGIGSFASHLIEALEAQPQGIEFRRYRPKNGQDMNTPARLSWEAFELPGNARRDGVDALYSPGFSPPPSGRFRKIVTV